MAKLNLKPKNIEVIKKTISLAAPTGDTTSKATPDSTAFFNKVATDRTNNAMKYFDQQVAKLKKYGIKDAEGIVSGDSEFTRLLNMVDAPALAAMRQANKGKPGFDENGYPIKSKNTSKTMADVKSKTSAKK